MSKDDKIKSIQIETVEILVKYLKAIAYTDLTRSEGQARGVSEIALAINAILRDL